MSVPHNPPQRNPTDLLYEQAQTLNQIQQLLTRQQQQLEQLYAEQRIHNAHLATLVEAAQSSPSGTSQGTVISDANVPFSSIFKLTFKVMLSSLLWGIPLYLLFSAITSLLFTRFLFGF